MSTPRSRTALVPRALLLVAVVAVAIYVPLQTSSYHLSLVNNALLICIGAVALTVLTGSAGQVSIGTAAFLALGGWTIVVLPTGTPFLLKLVAAGVVCAFAGMLIGLPSLRLRGMYLSLATLAFQYIVVYGLSKYETAKDSPGGFILEGSSIGGWSLDEDTSWYVVILAVLVVVMLLARALLAGKPGRAWAAIREHDIAAAAAGVEVTRYKLSAFTLSSFAIGVAGALQVLYLQTLSTEPYNLNLAIEYIAIIIIGGLGSIYGAVIGAFLVSFLPQMLSTLSTSLGTEGNDTITRNLAFFEQIAYGLVVILVLYVEPGGIAGVGRRLTRLAQGLRFRRTEPSRG